MERKLMGRHSKSKYISKYPERNKRVEKHTPGLQSRIAVVPPRRVAVCGATFAGGNATGSTTNNKTKKENKTKQTQNKNMKQKNKQKEPTRLNKQALHALDRATFTRIPPYKGPRDK